MIFPPFILPCLTAPTQLCTLTRVISPYICTLKTHICTRYLARHIYLNTTNIAIWCLTFFNCFLFFNEPYRTQPSWCKLTRGECTTAPSVGLHHLLAFTTAKKGSTKQRILMLTSIVYLVHSLQQGLGLALGVIWTEVLVLRHLLLQAEVLALQLAAQSRQRVPDVVGQLLAPGGGTS